MSKDVKLSIFTKRKIKEVPLFNLVSLVLSDLPIAQIYSWTPCLWPSRVPVLLELNTPDEV